MNVQIISRLCASALLASLISGCASGGGTNSPIPSQQSAQQASAPSAGSILNTRDAASSVPRQYRAVQLDPLAGGFAVGISDNDESWVSGYSLTTAGTLHAALWDRGVSSATDLGTLGGDNSAVEWPNHAFGQVVGISQLATADPLGEQWSCSYPAGGGFLPYTGQECRGFRWTRSGMRSLGTLGGNNSFASGANWSGQTVGWAETNVHDATCVSPQVLQFKATLWFGNGRPLVLRPLAGDPDSAATAINNRGTAVGISGICGTAVGALSAAHMVLWRYGAPARIPGLGGSAWNTPTMVNDSESVVGFADLSGDNNGQSPNPHAFLWTARNGTQNLGTLPGDSVSYAYGINNMGTIVGQSCTAGCAQSRAFLYIGRKMYDLNTLLDSSGANLQLAFANDINDQGQITGAAINTATHEVVGYRLIPTGALMRSEIRPQAPAVDFAAYRIQLGPLGRMIPTFARH